MIATAAAARALASQHGFKSFSQLKIESEDDKERQEEKRREFLMAAGKREFPSHAEELSSDPLLLWCYVDKAGVIQAFNSPILLNVLTENVPIMKHVGANTDSFEEVHDLIESCDCFTKSKCFLSLACWFSLYVENWNPPKHFGNPLAVRKPNGGEHTLNSLHFTGASDWERPVFLYLPKLFPYRVGHYVPIGAHIKTILDDKELPPGADYPWGFKIWVQGIWYCFEYNDKNSLNALPNVNKVFMPHPNLTVDPGTLNRMHIEKGKVYTQFYSFHRRSRGYSEARSRVVSKIDEKLVIWYAQVPTADDEQQDSTDATSRPEKRQKPNVDIVSHSESP
jgi:hypothetical protein